MTFLVEYSMLYEADIWGCYRSLEALEQVRTTDGTPNVPCVWGWNSAPQMGTAMGSGRELPVVGLVRARCTLYWLKVLSR